MKQNCSDPESRILLSTLDSTSHGASAVRLSGFLINPFGDAAKDQPPYLQ
jgi:hypothetical protein